MLSFARALLPILIVLAAEPSSAQSSAKGDPFPQRMREKMAFYKSNPMAIYLARGSPHSCGENCDTWIVAEGSFDPGAAHRLLRFVSEPGRDRFPVFFNSRGGIVSEAIEIGIMLRVRNMTAGVARTVSRECSRLGKEQCDKLRESGKPLAGELFGQGAICHSACVYALIGATTRRVLPEAKVGVHSPTAFLVARDGRVSGAPEKEIAKFRASLDRYVSGMGIASGLLDVTMSVPAERVRILSREEMFRFKIDPRDVIESRWTIEQTGSRATVVKSVTEQRDGPKPDFRPSRLRLTCERRDRVKIEYERPLVASEADLPSAIKFGTADRAVAFPEKDAAGAPLVDRVRAAHVPSEFLVSAAAVPEIEIAETFLPRHAEPWSRKVVLSTAGLSEALEALLSRCL